VLKSLSDEEKRKLDDIFGALIFIVKDYWIDKKTGLLSVVVQTFKPIKANPHENYAKFFKGLPLIERVCEVLQMIKLKENMFHLIIKTRYPRQTVYHLSRWGEICKEVIRERMGDKAWE